MKTKGKTMSMNWISEHGKEYEVPEERLRQAGLWDLSWHNDLCPHFGYAEDTKCKLRLWIEHPNPEIRETSECRFIVAFDPVGILGESNWDEGYKTFETDDLEQALAKMAEWRKEI